MNYQILKDFIKAIVKSVKIGLNETELGVATYSDFNKFQLHINFSSYSNTSEIVEAVQRISYDAGDTYTGNGLNRIRAELFSRSRNGIPKVLIVITDGQSQDSVETPSSTLRAMKVHIMSIGIGDVVYAELAKMATDPDNQNVFTANFSSIHDVVGSIIENNCRGKCKMPLSGGGLWVFLEGLELLPISTQRKRNSVMSELPRVLQMLYPIYVQNRRGCCCYCCSIAKLMNI